MSDIRERAALIAEINESELTARMIEAAASLKRPEGLTAEQALGIADDVVVARYRKAARAAMDYWRECINNGSVPS